MGIIGELRKALIARHKSGVVFTHVPKCGGTSVQTALFRHFRLSREHILPVESRAAERLGAPHLRQAAAFPEFEALELRKQLVAYALSRDVKCITGHNPINEPIMSAHKGTHKFVTVLRDPVERFCSHYRFVYKSGVATAVDEKLDDFLETNRARWFGSIYVTYFGGAPAAKPVIEQSSIERAQKIVSGFDAVGFLDRMDKFQQQLRDLLGVNVKIDVKNRTKDRATHWRGEISDQQLERIREICRPNIEVYEYARKRCLSA
jgi:hypothetical protein